MPAGQRPVLKAEESAPKARRQCHKAKAKTRAPLRKINTMKLFQGKSDEILPSHFPFHMFWQQSCLKWIARTQNYAESIHLDVSTQFDDQLTTTELDNSVPYKLKIKSCIHRNLSMNIICNQNWLFTWVFHRNLKLRVFKDGLISNILIFHPVCLVSKRYFRFSSISSSRQRLDNQCGSHHFPHPKTHAHKWLINESVSCNLASTMPLRWDS